MRHGPFIVRRDGFFPEMMHGRRGRMRKRWVVIDRDAHDVIAAYDTAHAARCDRNRRNWSSIERRTREEHSR